MISGTFSPTLLAALNVVALATTEGQVPGASDGGVATVEDEEDEDENEDVEILDEQGRVKVTVKTKAAGEASFFAAFPKNEEEAGTEKFYGSIGAAQAAHKKAWLDRIANNVRNGMEAAKKNGMDLNVYAQNIADNYKYGRRGGYIPTIGESAIRGATSVDDVIALLKAAGVNLV